MTPLEENLPPKLRVGLLVDGLSQPAWVAKIVADLKASEYAQLAVIVRDATPPAPRPRFIKLWKNRLRDGPYALYERWDHRRHPAKLDAFAEVSLEPLIEGVPVLGVLPARTRYCDRFAPDDLAAIRAMNLDVLIRFGFRILKGDILRAARCGVWSFHHGDNREYRGSAAGFWEVYERNPVTGSILQVLNESLDNGQVLYRSWSATDFGSQYASINPMFWKTSAFILRRLRDLCCEGWEWLQALPEFREQTPYKKPYYRSPGARTMTRFLLAQAGSKLAGRARLALAPQQRHWYIAFRQRRVAAVWQDASGFQRLDSPSDRYYADPFLVENRGRTYLFFEDCAYSTGRARIAFAELAPDGLRGEPEVALERPYHLSYPCIFEADGEMYMIPESRQARRVELYRATAFPRGWTLEAVLLDNVEAVDATLCRHGGRFWMFVNLAVAGASTHDELHLFSASAPTGPWRPHPRNPIVSDVRRARPAGALFEHEGAWIRPSQDCGLRYGSAIEFQRIENWTEFEYREQPLARLSPNWSPDNIGTHTYNRSRDFEVLDGLEMVPRRRAARLAASAPVARSQTAS